MDPFFGAVTPDGRWSIRVTEDEIGPGWYCATVTLDGRTVVESLTTADADKLIRWTHRQMTEALRRSG